jgi:hypothetical protein
MPKRRVSSSSTSKETQPKAKVTKKLKMKIGASNVSSAAAAVSDSHTLRMKALEEVRHLGTSSVEESNVSALGAN